MKALMYLLSFSLLFLLFGCKQEQELKGSQPHYTDAPSVHEPVLVFGIHPLYNPQRLEEIFSPLIDYLSQNMPPQRFILEASKDYADYNAKLREGRFDFAMPNPYQTVFALEHGYEVIAKVAPDNDFMGIILTPKTETPMSLSSLKGKTIGFPAPSALAATMLPQWLMFQQGLKPHVDYEVRYVVSQESSILAVANGITQASATIPPAWRQFQQDYPELAEKLQVSWQTQTLPNIGVVARKSLPEETKASVTKLLTQLQTNDEGNAILAKTKLGHFETANRDTYQPVVNFVNQFEQQIRKAETP